MTTVILMLRKVDDVAKVRYVMYRCECGATDTMKLFESEQAPMAIDCWKCHAGQGGGKGMIPTTTVPAKTRAYVASNATLKVRKIKSVDGIS